MTMERIIGENSGLAKGDAARANRNFAALETASHVGVTATAAELNILDGVTATTEEINNAADISASSETYTVAEATTVTAGVKSIIFNQTTGNITATIADATNHAGMFSCKALGEPDGGHTLTLTAGTFDGTNNVATFADALDALVVCFDHTGNGVVVANIGSVVLS